MHVGSDVWFEVSLIDNSMMPLNFVYENKFYLNFKDIFNSKNMSILREMLGEKLENKGEEFERSLSNIAL